MRSLSRFTLAAGLLLAAAGSAYATYAVPTGTTPVGTWKQIDDMTGKATSLLQITNQRGGLEAKVLKTLYMTPEQIARDGVPPRCTQCKGARHNQPINGMTIMWGVHKGSKNNVWDGGHILDPDNGMVYSVRLQLKNNGSKLAVRGYIKTPLLGRTQTWLRQ